jgi:uncharacterized integral membrane protein
MSSDSGNLKMTFMNTRHPSLAPIRSHWQSFFRFIFIVLLLVFAMLNPSSKRDSVKNIIEQSI